MIHLINQITISKRKMVSMIFIMTLMCILLYYLNIEHFSRHATMKIITTILGFIISWIAIDMTHPSEVMIRGYRHERYIKRYKHIVLMFWTLQLTVFISLFMLMIKILHHGVFIQEVDIKCFFHLTFDLYIIGICVIKLSKLKHPTLSFIVPVLFTLFQLLIDYKESLLLYRVLPLFQPMILEFKLAIAYKLCYISLGLLISNVRFKKPFILMISVDK